MIVSEGTTTCFFDKSRKGALIREAVEEKYLTEEKIRRMKDAVDSLLKLAEESPTPPENWDTWEEEYTRLKKGRKSRPRCDHAEA